MMDRDGRWTGKYGIRSLEGFLGDPDGQEKALGDFLTETKRQLRANGSFAYLGSIVEGRIGRFAITRAGLIAAGHRCGARATHDYLQRIANNGFSSRRLTLSPGRNGNRNRLRTFADAAYE